MSEPMYERCLEVLGDVCGDEDEVIRRVERRFNEEGELTADFAVQQWLTLLERRRVKKALSRREKVDNARTQRNHVPEL